MLDAVEVQQKDRTKLMRHFRTMRCDASTPGVSRSSSASIGSESKVHDACNTRSSSSSASTGTRGRGRAPLVVGVASITRRLRYSPARPTALPDYRQIEESLLARSVGDERARQIMESRDAHDEQMYADAIGALESQGIRVLCNRRSSSMGAIVRL